MNLQTIATHTIDVDLLPVRGMVLDAGCRDFDFETEISKLGLEVIGIDPSEEVWESKFIHHPYEKFALVGEGKQIPARLVTAGNGSRITFDLNESYPVVPTVTMKELVDAYGKFSVVKLDIEGSEYDVLLTWPGPVATQISVEFHEHTNLGKAVHGDDIYERIDRHLGQWYRKVKDDVMDTLYVLQ